MKRKMIYIYGILSGIVLITTFQNCAKAPLEKIVPVVKPFTVKGVIEICLDNKLANYTVENFIISNLNIAASRGGLMPDIDADGIADRDEEALGFNIDQRRTNGKILDSVCLNISGSSNCINQIQACDSSKNVLGLNECDIKTLGLDQLYGHPAQGLDSDKDGIPDFLEIIRNTSPNINDRNADPDHDGVMNWVEIQNGTNPNYANGAVDPSKILKYKVTKLPESGSCHGELWGVAVDQLPFTPISAYQDPLDLVSPLSPILSHEQDENIIMVSLKLKSKTGYSGNSKIYFKDFKINQSVQDFNFIMSDFIEAGEVLP